MVIKWRGELMKVMKYLIELHRDEVTITYVPTGQVFYSWESAIAHDIKN